MTRGNASFWEIWPVLHESANVVRLTASVGENNRYVRDEDRKNGGDRGGPADVVDEQEDGDPKAHRAERHHDQIPALAIGDVLRHRPPRLGDHMDVAAAAPVPDPHAPTVSPRRVVPDTGTPAWRPPLQPRHVP